MILCDVNVIVYAFRDDVRDHQKYLTWLKSVAGGESAYGMSPQVLGAMARLVTNPKIFNAPSRIDDAMTFANALLDQPNCVSVLPGPRHWGIFSRLCVEASATGNLVADAWFAALAIESGCEWVTTDRDYARFKGLRWRTPF